VVAANLIQARGWTAGGGSPSSALICGGSSHWDYSWTKLNNSPEEFNGTAWFAAGNLTSVRVKHVADGNGSNGICFGGITGGGGPSGYPESDNRLASTEMYNGSAWSGGGNLCTARSWHSGGGSSIDAISSHGDASYPQNTYTEIYNGTAWSTDATVLLMPGAWGRGGGGNSSDAYVGGGASSATGIYAAYEKYNGTSWYGVTNLLKSRRDLIMRGDLAAGGNTGYGATNFCEEFNGAQWEVGGSLITARSLLPEGALR